MENQAPPELFRCDQCGKDYTEEEGSWPKVTKQGTLRVIFTIFDTDEDDYPKNFMCYDCIDKCYGDCECHDEYEQRIEDEKHKN